MLSIEIRSLYEESRKTYGSPRIHQALRKRGVRCSKKRVERLMRKEGLISVHRKRFRPTTTNSRHSLPVAANLLQQDFSAQCCNQKWVGDITYIPTAEGWLYLAVILDLYSRKVVGWATGANIDAELVCQAFRVARLRRHAPKRLVYHSDRGSQYASFKFQRLLMEAETMPSMSRRGNVYDNAVAESFYHTLKVELVHRNRYDSRAEAKASIAEYIEQFYNPERLHSSIGYCSPNQFENLMVAA
jgi:transposase InsO family protein